ncbi:MAG: hypothetical protein ACO26F_01935 [Burkholderiaceae bacterium]
MPYTLMDFSDGIVHDAAWASTQPQWGLPVDCDPLEGWIVSAGA